LTYHKIYGIIRGRVFCPFFYWRYTFDNQLSDYVELKKNKNNNVFFGQAKDKEA